MNVKCTFSSAGCNRNTNCMYSSVCGMVAYAANNNIALVRGSPPTVFKLLSAHKGKISCLKFIENEENLLGIVSGSSDGTIKIFDSNWQVVASSDLGSSVASLCCIPSLSDPDNIIIAVGLNNGLLKVFNTSYKESTFELVFEKSFPSTMIMAMSAIKAENVLIFCFANAQSKIDVFYWNQNSLKFMQSLSGHENWIRSLDFCMIDNYDLHLF